MNKSERRNMLALFNALSGMGFSDAEIEALRRIEMTLQRWGEQECGDERGAIERDEATGKPYWLNANTGRRFPVPDRERGALKRLGKIMADHPDFLAYHQTDCRGCNLYILRKSQVAAGESVESVYNRGVAVCY